MGVLRREAAAPKQKTAIRHAMQLHLEETLPNVTDPCTSKQHWMDLWCHVQKPICFRKAPPRNWFKKAQVLGVDWEGCPPSLVQIACERGVYIDSVSSLAAAKVLADGRHTHAVYGENETSLVSRPLNLQVNPRLSLAETVSIELCPLVRLEKNKAIRRETDWADLNSLGERELQYAALDAEMTRRVALKRAAA